MAYRKWKRFIQKAAFCLLVAATLAMSDKVSTVSAAEDANVRKKDALADAIVANPDSTIKGHKLVAENDNLQLYLYEPALSLIIRDKKTGAIMESTVGESDGNQNATWESFIHSGVNFEILNAVTEEKSDLLAAGAKIDVTYVDNGFSAAVYLEKYQISFTLNVALEEDGFTAEIPNTSIVEELSDAKVPITLGKIYLFPFLGHTYLDERTGYMLVPDGNGMLIYLEDNEGEYNAPLSVDVWGGNVGVNESYVLSLLWNELQTVNEAQLTLAPIYGMVHTDSQMAVLSIIEEGAEDAKIYAYPNGAIMNYNWITPCFTLRRIYSQFLSVASLSGVQMQESEHTECDIRVRYIFTSGEEADYVGLAKKYREYLLKEQGLTEKDEGFRIKLDFMGSDREEGLLGLKTVVMTTADNIRDIYDDLEAAGVTDITSVYKGWQKGGIWSVPITKYKADSAIGGTRDLTKLIEEADARGIQLYLYQDALRANPSTVNTTFDVIKQLNERAYVETTYKEVFPYFNYQTPAKAVERLNSTVASYQKSHITRLALTGITDHLFTYTYKGVSYSRTNTLDVFRSTMENVSESMELMMETPFSCYWEMADGIMGMPVRGSDYIFTDEEVPFLSIALKGIMPMYADYTNFEANKSKYFLQLVETGIYPSFYLTWENPVSLIYTNSSDLYTSQYSVYKDVIIDYYKRLKAVNDAVIGATITDRERVGDDVVVVTYSNGVKIYLNYGKKAVTYDGISIDGMSYKVGEAG